MEIASIHLTDFRNEEHYNTALVTKYTAATLGIQTLYPSYQTSIAKETEALNVIRKSTITDDLIDADALRDKTFKGLAANVKAATNHYLPEIKNTAKRLQILFDNYGNVAIKPYNEETETLIQRVITTLLLNVKGVTIRIQKPIHVLRNNKISFIILHSVINNGN